MAKHIESGLFQMGGATLRSPPEFGKLDIDGSVIVARAVSSADVLSVLQQDIYCRARVWALKKAVIRPVRQRVLQMYLQRMETLNDGVHNSSSACTGKPCYDVLAQNCLSLSRNRFKIFKTPRAASYSYSIRPAEIEHPFHYIFT